MEVKEAGRMIWMLKFAEGDQLSVWRWEGCRAEDQRVAGREAEFIRLAVKNTWFFSTVLYTTALVSKGILSLATSCVFCNWRHLLRDGNVAILLSWTGGEQIHPCSVEIGASEQNKCRNEVQAACSGPHIHRPGQTPFQWGFPDIQMAVNKLQERLLCVRRVFFLTFQLPRRICFCCSDRCKREGGSDDSQDEAIACSKTNDRLLMQELILGLPHFLL